MGRRKEGNVGRVGEEEERGLPRTLPGHVTGPAATDYLSGSYQQ